jgi:hypothetical protein
LHVGGRADVYIGFRWEYLRERPLGRPRCSWEGDIEMDLQEVGWGLWTGSSWLRIGTGGGYL